MANKKNHLQIKPLQKYIDLFCMTPSNVSAKDIALVIQEQEGFVTELWEEMNVLELVLPSGSSVDFEPLEASFQDPSDASFIKNRGINTIFAIKLAEEELSVVIPAFEKLIARYSGFVCADSVDFTPVYAGSSKK